MTGYNISLAVSVNRLISDNTQMVLVMDFIFSAKNKVRGIIHFYINIILAQHLSVVYSPLAFVFLN